MARSFCSGWLKGCVLALLLGNAILPASASAQAPPFLLQWSTASTRTGEFPSGVAVDAGGHVYVSDMSGRIQKFTTAGTFLTQWGTMATSASRSSRATAS